MLFLIYLKRSIRYSFSLLLCKCMYIVRHLISSLEIDNRSSEFITRDMPFYPRRIRGSSAQHCSSRYACMHTGKKRIFIYVEREGRYKSRFARGTEGEKGKKKEE